MLGDRWEAEGARRRFKKEETDHSGIRYREVSTEELCDVDDFGLLT